VDKNSLGMDKRDMRSHLHHHQMDFSPPVLSRQHNRLPNSEYAASVEQALYY